MLRSTQFSAIGTSWKLSAGTELSTHAWDALLKSVDVRIEQFDQSYSRFRSDSLVTKIAHHAGTFALPEDGYILLTFYETLYRVTNGLVTPLIGQPLSDAGYDASYSLRVGTPTTPPSWEDVISYNRDSITVIKPALLDFGAAGKGYLVDIIAAMLEAEGVNEYTLDASGDIRHQSASQATLEVGLENPHDTTEVISVANIGNQSLCASAGSKRAWGDYTHILNPRTLQSPTDISASWVVAAETMIADGVATALFFVDAEQLASSFDFEYALLSDDMELTYSRSFPVTVFEAYR